MNREQDLRDIMTFVKNCPEESGIAMPDPDKYERSMNGLRKLICEPKMDGSGTIRGEGWDAAARKAWHFFDRHLRRKS